MSQRAARPEVTFQLFEGGYFFGLTSLLRRLHTHPLSNWLKFACLLSIGWLPLLVLSALQHMAIGRGRADSFLLDISFHIRFLIALPMILLLPAKIAGKLETLVNHFLSAKLVSDSERQRFLNNIGSVMSLRNSRIANTTIVLVVYVTAALLQHFVLPDVSPSWRTLGGEGRQHLSLAGWWFLWISEPVYELVFYRFLYRVGLWWVFLWKTSKLDLQLDAAHPDGFGGLGFLGLSLRTFKEAAFAISTAFAGALATVVLLTHAKVSSYKYEIGAVVLMTTTVFTGPLLFFYGALVRTKSRDVLRYWALWQAQHRQFRQKWLNGPPEHADMLSVPDFSEATDLSQILERVGQVKLVPFGRKQIQPLIIAALMPFLAVLLLEFPFEEILKQVLKMGGFKL